MNGNAATESTNPRSARRRAAVYVRMSTDLQNFSIQHQSDRIYGYAAEHEIDIIKMYADEGKSGLTVRDRGGLGKLLDDVRAGTTDFSVILVYDISRWGRFQDVDESAYYDHLCRRAGIEVIYCAEQFDNDGSAVSAILKSLKRAMAAEYSRELSVKVFEAQCSFIKMGFRQGGSAGYGFRRISVSIDDPNGQALQPGQRKINLTDRVRLDLGPADEIAVIHLIYAWYLDDGLTEKEIAGRLNAMGVPSETLRPWTRWRICGVLTNEKYIGRLIFNRKSVKLRRPPVKNPANEWIRTADAFSSIVPIERFMAAQDERARRARFSTDAELLEMLRALHDRVGPLSVGVLKNHEGIPGHKAYIGRFGSLSRAYELAGIPILPNVLKRVTSRRRLKPIRRALLSEVITCMSRAGAEVSKAGSDMLLVINRAVVVKVCIGLSRYGYKHQVRWKVPMDDVPRPDFVLAILLDKENTRADRFYLIPRNRVQTPAFIFKEERPDDFVEFRAATLPAIFGQQDYPAVSDISAS